MVKVRDDKYKQYEEESQEMSDKFGYKPSECTPVDLYGHRVNLDQDDSSNLSKTAEDIQEFYGLNPSPTQPPNDGLAKEDESSDY